MHTKIFRWAAVLPFCVGVWEAQGAAGTLTVAAGTLTVDQAWAAPTAPGAAVGAVYLRIVNAGVAEDRLLSVDAPVAAKVALHDSQITDGLMQMREVTSVVCPANTVVKAEPGGLHLMLMGLARPLRAGATFPLTLHFRDAGTLVASVRVKPRG